MFKQTRSYTFVIAALATLAWLSSWPVAWAGGYSQTVPTRTPTPHQVTAIPVTVAPVTVLPVTQAPTEQPTDGPGEPTPTTPEPIEPTQKPDEPTPRPIQVTATADTSEPRSRHTPSPLALTQLPPTPLSTAIPTLPAATGVGALRPALPMPSPTQGAFTSTQPTDSDPIPALRLTATRALAVAPPNVARPGAAQAGVAQSDATQPNAAQMGAAQPDAPRPDLPVLTPAPGVPAASTGVPGGLCAAAATGLLLILGWLIAQRRAKRVS